MDVNNSRTGVQSIKVIPNKSDPFYVYLILLPDTNIMEWNWNIWKQKKMRLKQENVQCGSCSFWSLLKVNRITAKNYSTFSRFSRLLLWLLIFQIKNVMGQYRGGWGTFWSILVALAAVATEPRSGRSGCRAAATKGVPDVFSPWWTSPLEICASGGGLLVAPINAPRLFF